MFARATPRRELPGRKPYFSLFCDLTVSTLDLQYGHSLVVNPLGEIVAEADEHGATVIANIGKP